MFNAYDAETRKQIWTLLDEIRSHCYELSIRYGKEALKKKYTRKGNKGMGSRLRGISRGYFDVWIWLAKKYPQLTLKELNNS